MKKKISTFLAALLMALCLTGCEKVAAMPAVTDAPVAQEESGYTANSIDTDAASDLRDQKYTNVPGTPTQNAVLEYTITDIPEEGEETVFPVSVLEPDERIVEALTDIYEFVQEQEKMPVRYFPEEVQIQVQKILNATSIDVVDILHMTEFFGIWPEVEIAEGETARGRVVLDEDYKVGQLVVVMFGDTTDMDPRQATREELDKIHWTPLTAKVKKQGEITFDIPWELMDEIRGEETLFLVLTIRPGAGGEETMEQWWEEVSGFIPSKDSSDLSGVYDVITSSSGEILPDNFRIFIQEHTSLSREEILRLQRYMQQEESPITSYFTENLRQQMSLLLEDVQPEELICYNASYLGAENYVETYGDVIAGLRFAADYPDGTEVVCVLGTLKDPLPDTQREEPVIPEESMFDWAVLRGEVRDGYVFITFPQQLIPAMEQEGALALIMSEPITPRG